VNSSSLAADHPLWRCRLYRSIETSSKRRHGDNNFAPHILKARLQQFEDGRYLTDLYRAGAQPGSLPGVRIAQLKEKIGAARDQMQKLRTIEGKLLQTPDQPVSLTDPEDPDARSMARSGGGTGIVGYDVQAAFDTHHDRGACRSSLGPAVLGGRLDFGNLQSCHSSSGVRTSGTSASGSRSE
jgi:hypothetical protein